MNLMTLNNSLSLTQFCSSIQLPTNDDKRWNDYYNRQSKLNLKKSFLEYIFTKTKSNLYKIII